VGPSRGEREPKGNNKSNKLAAPKKLAQKETHETGEIYLIKNELMR